MNLFEIDYQSKDSSSEDGSRVYVASDSIEGALREFRNTSYGKTAMIDHIKLFHYTLIIPGEKIKPHGNIIGGK